MIDGPVQEPRSGLRPGDRVRARGDDWRVTATTAGRNCEAIELAGAGAANHGVRRTLLHPFDRLTRLAGGDSPKKMTARRWAGRLTALLEASAPFDGLRRAGRAALQLLPYQLEPALAIVRGLATRVLIADEPGLGKTVQAGLALSELIDRQQARRTLILAPAGLRDQWRRELADRFSLESTIVDARELRQLVSALPAGTNPWQLPGIRIASLDFVKQPEVLQGVAALAWDVLIVDEAHHAVPSSDRGRAFRSLARRARHVLLLTATPHGGRDDDFTALCRAGRLSGDEPPLALFRRNRADAGLPSTRRVTLLAVRQTPLERNLQRLLDGYLRELLRSTTDPRRGHVRLIGILLRRRGLSCCRSLASSVARRRALLEGAMPGTAQVTLPFGFEDDDLPEDDVPGALLAAPGLSNVAREQVWLDAIAEAATRAEPTDSKLAALRRLLRRILEPAIVFTEYRDTLACVLASLDAPGDAVLLHGGLSARERLEAEGTFTSGRARLLLATDAAGEGLNLHARCRLVINLEVPWTPARLEQRIGRVDRIGQTRTPHAVLLAARDSAESLVLGRLMSRLRRVRLALDPTCGRNPATLHQAIEDALIANRPLAGNVPDVLRDEVSHEDLPPAGVTGFRRIDLAEAAAANVARLQGARRRPGSRRPAPDSIRRPLFLHLRRRPPHRRTSDAPVPRACLIAIHTSRLVDDASGLLETAVVVHRIGLARVPCEIPRCGLTDWTSRVLSVVLPRLRAEAQRRADDRRSIVQPAHLAAIAAVRLRARLIRAALARETDGHLQLELFGRQRCRAPAAAGGSSGDDDLADLDAGGTVRTEAPELDLVLLVTDR